MTHQNHLTPHFDPKSVVYNHLLGLLCYSSIGLSNITTSIALKFVLPTKKIRTLRNKRSLNQFCNTSMFSDAA